MTEGPVRRRLKAERPMMILQGALEEFSRHGFAAARLDDVARHAGVTKGTIYVYFPSKEDLFIATLKAMMRPALDNLQELVAEPGLPALDILRRHFTFVADYIVNDACGRDIFRILLAEGHRFPALVERWSTEVLQPALATLEAVLRRGVASGEFRASAVSQFPQLVLAPIFLHHNWQVLFGDRQPVDTRGFFEAAIDLLAHGLMKPHARAP